MGRHAKPYIGESGYSNPNLLLPPSALSNAFAESDPGNIKFLSRSLERNDLDLSAVDKCNDELRRLRDALGEERLLEYCASSKDIEDEDWNRFTQLMKLRRRLLNRLSRRLNRVSRCADGEMAGVVASSSTSSTVSSNGGLYGVSSGLVAPPLPKYGDDKFDMGKERVDEWKDKKKKREEVMQKWKLLKEGGGGGEEDKEELKRLEKEIVEYDVGYGGSDVPTTEMPPIKSGGIGASQRNMSEKDKISEYKRWQNDLLARVPDQPTFKELNMDVPFCAEARLAAIKKKKLLQEEQQPGPEPEKDPETSPGDEEDGSDDDEQDASDDDDDDDEDSNTEQQTETMSVSSETSSSQVTDKQESSKPKTDDDSTTKSEDDADDDSTSKAEDDADNDSTAKEDDDAEEEEEEEVKEEENLKIEPKSTIKPPKPVPPFSIAPTPSFHAQDKRRMHTIHISLVETTLNSQIQSQIDEANQEFNKINKYAQDLVHQKLRLENELAKLLSTPTPSPPQPSPKPKKNDDYALQVAIAKANFTRDRANFYKHFQTMVVSNTLSNIIDRVILRHTRTPPPTDYRIIRANVRGHLDVVVRSAMYQAEKQRQYSSFVLPPDLRQSHHRPSPPPPPPPEPTKSAEVLAKEQELRTQLNDIQARITEAEEDRCKSWKKLTKIKSSLLPDHYQQPTKRHAASSRHSTPMPTGTPTSLASANDMTPPPLPQHPTPNSAERHTATGAAAASSTQHQIYQAKYSAESVKARIYPDGSVLPVSMPKKNKDGLYQRPAGRKRKGMDWDAIRGRWMPSNEME